MLLSREHTLSFNNKYLFSGRLQDNFMIYDSVRAIRSFLHNATLLILYISN